MDGRITIDLEIKEGQQPGSASRMADQQRGFTSEGAYPVAGSSSARRAAKWTDWMDSALIHQVLATDPINCGCGRTVAK